MQGVIPLHFEENAGQAPADIQFLVRAPGYAAAFDKGGAVLYARQSEASRPEFSQMRLLDCAQRPAAQGEGPIASSMLYGRDSGKLGLRLRNYTALRYPGVYPGVDWIWHFREGALEFEFELSAGADPAAIRMAFTGGSQLRLDRDGNLDVKGKVDLHYRRPEAWQDTRGGRVDVPVAFRIDAGIVGFEVGAHDPNLPLTIDPVVLYSRYLGGAGYDAAYAVATDAAGNVYVTGETNSVSFSASMGVTANRHAFLSKVSPDGTQIVYNVILASSGNDAGKAIALDPSGNIWVAGVTGGTGFPVTSGALSSYSAGGQHAFLARLSGSGQLSYSTYLGGSGTDAATALAVDSSGNVYVAGYSSSVNFPTTAGAPQRNFAGGTDAFLVKLGGGTTLSYATLLGGAGNDSANGVSVDGAGNACIAGRTDSPGLPVVNAVQPANAGNGNGNGLLACLNPAGTAWNTLTYLGGSGPAEVNAIARDAAGNIYLAGDLYSTSRVPTGTYAAFAMKLNSTGTSLGFTVPLAGSGASSATAIGVDSAGDIWLAGYTAAVDFPVTGPPAFAGSLDGFVAELSASGSTVLLANYLGGSGDDRCLGMALSGMGAPTVVGSTGSVDFPITIGAVPAPYNAFLAQVWTSAAPKIASVTPIAGSGSTTFGISASDANGYWAIGTVNLQISNALGGAGGCSVMYNRQTNALDLMSDDGTTWSSPVIPGSPASVSNSKCTLNANGSSVTRSATTLAVQFNISFQPAFSGTKNLYVEASDLNNTVTGWQNSGTFTVPGGIQVVSVVPGTGAGGAPTFTVTAQDGSGYAYIHAVYFLIDSGAFTGANSCWLMYVSDNNGLYLMNDAGNAWLPGVAPASAASVSNSQCTLNAAGSSITRSGTTLAMQFNVTFRPAFSGTRSLYLYGFDSNNGVTGWQNFGTFTIPGGIQVVSVVPGTGPRGAPTFTVTAQDGNGYASIHSVYFLIDSGAFTGANSCWLMYTSDNWLYLMNDAGNAWLPAVSPGSAATVSNSQCTLNAAASSVTRSGTALAIQFNLTFGPAFNGTRNLYLYGFDSNNGVTGWQSFGTFPISSSIQVVSVTRGTGAGGAPTFTVTAQDGNGYGYIHAVYFLIDSGTFTGANSCWLMYISDSNGLYLMNDAGNSWLPAVSPGSAATVSNSQCTLNAANSFITASGSTLAIQFNVTFQPTFSGTRNLYLYGFDANNGVTGWHAMGTTTISH